MERAEPHQHSPPGPGTQGHPPVPLGEEGAKRNVRVCPSLGSKWQDQQCTLSRLQEELLGGHVAAGGMAGGCCTRGPTGIWLHPWPHRQLGGREGGRLRGCSSLNTGQGELAPGLLKAVPDTVI